MEEKKNDNRETIKITIPTFLVMEKEKKKIMKKKKIRNILRIVLSGVLGFTLSLIMLNTKVNIVHNFLLCIIILVPGACLGIISGVCCDGLIKGKKEKSFFSLPIIVITPLVVLIYILILYLGMSIVDTVSEPKVTGNQNEEYSKTDDVAVLSLIKEESWSDLNMEERIAFSQYIADEEARLSGLPYTLEVVIKKLPEGVGGKYHHQTKQIIINEKYIKAEETTAFNIINVIAHECQHAVQFVEIEMLQSVAKKFQNLQIFQTIKVIADEFANYKGVGSKGYSEQFCEKQAVEKAEERMKYYIMLLEKDGK